MATMEGNQEEGRQSEKRPRTASSSPSSHSVTKATGDGAGGGSAQGAHEKPSSKLSSNSVSGGNKKVNREGLTFTIDPDLMDCPICFEELAPPIFQVDTESKKTASQKGTTPPSKPSSGPRTKLVNKRRTK